MWLQLMLWVWISGKNGWRGHIHPLIGALGREDNGNQQLVWIIIKEFRFSNREIFFEIVYAKLKTFFPGHKNTCSVKLN